MWKRLCLTDLDCSEGAHELALCLPNLYTVLATALSLDLGHRAQRLMRCLYPDQEPAHVLKRNNKQKIGGNCSSVVKLLNVSKTELILCTRKDGKNILFQDWFWAW